MKLRTFTTRPSSYLVLAFAVAGGCKHEELGSTGPQEPTVVVAQPLSHEVTEYATFTGQIQAVNDVAIRARVTGYLQKICYEPGSKVKQDDVLFEIDPSQYKAQFDQATAKLATSQAQVAEANAKVATAEAHLEFTRAKLAVDLDVAKTPGAISKVKLDESQAAAKEADAGVKAAKASVVAQEAAVEGAKADLEYARLNLDWTKVKAPISGRADRNLLTTGNLVAADNTVLTNIVTYEEVYAYFDVDERTLLEVQKKIRSGALSKRKDIPIGIGLQNEKGFPHQGTVDLVENKMLTTTGTMQVRALVKNPDLEFTPGNFVRIRVPVDEAREKLLVPERSLILDQGDRFVLVVDKDNKIEKRKVKAGPLDPQDESMRVIEDGLNADEWIVVQGRQRVRPGTTVKADRTTWSSKPAAESASKS